MFRATTPTHTFTLPFDTSQLEKVRITYEQNDVTILSKTEVDCVLEGKNIVLNLTQEDTLLFAPRDRVYIQLRVKTVDGKVVASGLFRKFPKECLDEEVL